jgi:predicted PurR-regulated permease PerM
MDESAADAAEAPASERDHMPRWYVRGLVVAMAIAASGLAAWWLMVRLRSLLVMLLVALFLSFALEPGVNALARRGWRRGAATGVCFLVLIVLVLGFVAAMVPVLVDQVGALVEEIPDLVEDAQQTELPFGLDVPEYDADRLVDTLKNYAGRIAGGLLGVGSALVGALFQMLTIGLFTFYLVADAPKIRRNLCSVLPPARQREVLAVIEIAVDKTGGYLYSRLLLASASAFVTAVFLAAFGIPYAVALGIWTGLVSQFVPTIGTFIAAALPLLIAFLDDSWKAIPVLAYVFVYQQVENYVLSPRITAKTMQIHPAVAFGAVIAGASILGAVGALLALPAAAIIQAFVSTYLKRHDVVDSHLVNVSGERPAKERRRWFRSGRAHPGPEPAAPSGVDAGSPEGARAV